MTDNNNRSGSEYAIIPSTINTTSAHDDICGIFSLNSEITPDNPDKNSISNICPKFIH
jgi:hypothetical protein